MSVLNAKISAQSLTSGVSPSIGGRPSIIGTGGHASPSFRALLRSSLHSSEHSQAQWATQLLDYILLQRLVAAIEISFSESGNRIEKAMSNVSTVSWLQARSTVSSTKECSAFREVLPSKPMQHQKADSNNAPIDNNILDIKENVPFRSEIIQAAQKHGLSPNLIQAVIKAESNFNPQAVSSVGAQGLMQLMPETAKELGVIDPFDPVQNINAGSQYLKGLLQRYHGDIRLALAAYNWGMGNLERNPERLPEETKKYVAKVIEFMDQKTV